MNVFFEQLILSSRNESESWLNILFIIVLAVFWILGGILKARSQKAGKSDEDEQATGKTKYSRSSADKVTTQKVTTQDEQLRSRIKRSRPKSVSQPATLLITEHKDEPVTVSKGNISEPHEQPLQSQSIDSFLNYADTDELKRAIVLYEIIGKPLSIRKPADYVF
ncbi:MAG: hypothetical protein MUP16_01100 [Sedimentisphaerales bacterium]|jgi:hypothetical protein|nr:hypothetical protein [Sedimentisphaerales bacterium]